MTRDQEHAFCAVDATCIRAYVHSGDHLTGCRICRTTDHTVTTCTRNEGVIVEPRYEFPYLPPACRLDQCEEHPDGRHIRFRTRKCLSGECTHAAQGLICGYAPPAPKQAPTPKPAPAPRKAHQHHDECESADGGSCTCDLIAEYGDQYERETY